MWGVCVCVCVCTYVYICVYMSIYVYMYMCVCVCIDTYTHTTKYYLPIRKNEILPFAATWIELEDIMLSEIRQRQIYDFIHVELKIQNRQT